MLDENRSRTPTFRPYCISAARRVNEKGPAVDRVDWHILDELQDDARLSFNELSRRVKLSPPAVAERVGELVRRVHDAGVQPGDLLFFGRGATAARPARVTHVGISLGGACFVHESTDVHENSFDPTHENYSEALLKSLLHVRRVVGADAAHGVVQLAEHPLYQPSRK